MCKKRVTNQTLQLQLPSCSNKSEAVLFIVEPVCQKRPEILRIEDIDLVLGARSCRIYQANRMSAVSDQNVETVVDNVIIRLAALA